MQLDTSGMVAATQADSCLAISYIIHLGLQPVYHHFKHFQQSLLSNMAKMSMVDQRLLQMQLEAMQTMRMLLAEKAFTVM